MNLFLIFAIYMCLMFLVYSFVHYDYIKTFFYKLKFNILSFHKKNRLKGTPEYKINVETKKEAIDDKLNNFKISDIETVIRYYNLDRSDPEVKFIIYDFDIKEIQKYIRNKKIQKLK